MGKLVGRFRSAMLRRNKRLKHPIPNYERHVDRLIRSMYPTQTNAYIMMRVNKKYDFPVDAELYPVVNKLRRLGFWMEGWDYGYINDPHSFIFCNLVLTDPKRNTCKKLAGSLAKLFNQVTTKVVLAEPQQLDPDVLYLKVNRQGCIHRQGVALVFYYRLVDQLNACLHVGKSDKQVLPGGPTIDGLWEELQVPRLKTQTIYAS